MSNPMDPGRLARMMADAVAPVRPGADALSRIHRGVRHRRTVHRTAAVIAAAVGIAGGAVAYQAAQGPTRSAPATTPLPSVSPSLGGRVPALDWDIDGDGRPDSAVIRPLGNAATTHEFQLVVHMSTLGTQTVRFTATVVVAGISPVIVGSVDAARDGHAEIFVQVGRGADFGIWTIFRLVDGHLTQMTLSGRPLREGVGGGVRNGSGFSCDGPGTNLVMYWRAANNLASTSWTVERDTYRWAGASLVLVSHRQATIHAPASSPQLAPYAGVRCGNLPQQYVPH